MSPEATYGPLTVRERFDVPTGHDHLTHLSHLSHLLSRSRDSFSTIALSCTYEKDDTLSARAIERAARSEEAKSVKSTGPAVEPTGLHAVLEWKVWWRKPDCWRDDIKYGSGGNDSTIIRLGESSNYSSSAKTLHTTRNPKGLGQLLRHRLAGRSPNIGTLEDRVRNMPLLSGSFSAAGWELRPIDNQRFCGRDGVLVRATWPSADPSPTPWDWIREYRLIVDRQRGVLLRCECLADDQKAIVVSVRSIQFDAPIPDSVFSYKLPPGTKTLWSSVT